MAELRRRWRFRSRDPVKQEKDIKYLNLVANAVMLQNVADITDVLSELASEGHTVTRALVSRLSPYMTEHIKRFGEYVLDMNEKPKPPQPEKLFLIHDLVQSYVRI